MALTPWTASIPHALSPARTLSLSACPNPIKPSYTSGSGEVPEPSPTNGEKDVSKSPASHV